MVIILCHDHAVVVDKPKIDWNQLLPTIESKNMVVIMIVSNSASKSGLPLLYDDNETHFSLKQEVQVKILKGDTATAPCR